MCVSPSGSQAKSEAYMSDYPQVPRGPQFVPAVCGARWTASGAPMGKKWGICWLPQGLHRLVWSFKIINVLLWGSSGRKVVKKQKLYIIIIFPIKPILYPMDKPTCGPVLSIWWCRPKWCIPSLTVVFPLSNPFPQQSEMLINQLREITGVQDPQLLYRALNVRPKKSSSAAAFTVGSLAVHANEWPLYSKCNVITQSQDDQKAFIAKHISNSSML